MILVTSSGNEMAILARCKIRYQGIAKGQSAGDGICFGVPSFGATPTIFWRCLCISSDGRYRLIIMYMVGGDISCLLDG